MKSKDQNKRRWRQSIASAVLVAAFSQPCAHGAVSLTTLFSFSGTNGSAPEAALIQGSDTNFYGTTHFGFAYGTVFRMTPDGHLTNLVYFYSFNGTNGTCPNGLVQGSDGNFYGTAPAGGAHDNGTIFRVSPDGKFTNLYSFTGGADGGYPRAALVRGQDGNFYGTTQYGGARDLGTIFRFAPSGTLTNIYSFSGTDGAYPQSPLLLASDGNFYGTAYDGGSQSHGTIFKLTPGGTLTTLHSFDGTNGEAPWAGLIQGKEGALYGTTFYGGPSFTPGPDNGPGTVFRITTNGTFTRLYSFTGAGDGAGPTSALVQAADGSLYGTTSGGGLPIPNMASGGTIFRITTNGLFTTMVLFNGTNGAGLVTLMLAKDGRFYGTAAQGGPNGPPATGNGTIFRLDTYRPQPVFQSVWHTNRTIVMTWSALTGETYQVQYTTNLNGPYWTNLNPPLMATNAIMATSDSIGQQGQRFYRVVLLP